MLETDGFRSGSWTPGGVGNPTEGWTPQLPLEEGRTGERGRALAWWRLLQVEGSADRGPGASGRGFMSQLCPVPTRTEGERNP